MCASYLFYYYYVRVYFHRFALNTVPLFSSPSVTVQPLVISPPIEPEVREDNRIPVEVEADTTTAGENQQELAAVCSSVSSQMTSEATELELQRENLPASESPQLPIHPSAQSELSSADCTAITQVFYYL